MKLLLIGLVLASLHASSQSLYKDSCTGKYLRKALKLRQQASPDYVQTFRQYRAAKECPLVENDLKIEHQIDRLEEDARKEWLSLEEKKTWKADSAAKEAQEAKKELQKDILMLYKSYAETEYSKDNFRVAYLLSKQIDTIRRKYDSLDYNDYIYSLIYEKGLNAYMAHDILYDTCDKNFYFLKSMPLTLLRVRAGAIDQQETLFSLPDTMNSNAFYPSMTQLGNYLLIKKGGDNFLLYSVKTNKPVLASVKEDSSLYSFTRDGRFFVWSHKIDGKVVGDLYRLDSFYHYHRMQGGMIENILRNGSNEINIQTTADGLFAYFHASYRDLSSSGYYFSRTYNQLNSAYRGYIFQIDTILAKDGRVIQIPMMHASKWISVLDDDNSNSVISSREGKAFLSDKNVLICVNQWTGKRRSARINRALYLFNVRTGSVERKLHIGTDNSTFVLKDGVLLYDSADNLVRVDLAGGTRTVVALHGSRYSYSPDLRYALLFSEKSFELWNLHNGEKLPQAELPGGKLGDNNVSGLFFPGIKDLLYLTSAKDTILYSLTTHRTQKLSGRTSSTTLKFASDKEHFCYENSRGEIHFANLHTGDDTILATNLRTKVSKHPYSMVGDLVYYVDSLNQIMCVNTSLGKSFLYARIPERYDFGDFPFPGWVQTEASLSIGDAYRGLIFLDPENNPYKHLDKIYAPFDELEKKKYGIKKQIIN